MAEAECSAAGVLELLPGPLASADPLPPACEAERVCGADLLVPDEPFGGTPTPRSAPVAGSLPAAGAGDSVAGAACGAGAEPVPERGEPFGLRRLLESEEAPRSACSAAPVAAPLEIAAWECRLGCDPITLRLWAPAAPTGLEAPATEGLALGAAFSARDADELVPAPLPWPTLRPGTGQSRSAWAETRSMNATRAATITTVPDIAPIT